MVMPYHLHMPSYFLETFTEYPYLWQTEDVPLRVKTVNLLSMVNNFYINSRYFSLL